MSRPRRACGGKRRYRDHAEAVRTLHRVASRSTRQVVPVRAYWCPACRGFHLTHKPLR